MTKAILDEPRFKDDEAARQYLESVRWPNGPVCPHCGGADRQSRLQGETQRDGLMFCGHCRAQYTVTVGTVFERSHIPLHKWVLANHLLNSSKKGISSHQLHRTLGVTYKTAWFMSHRIREAMKTTPTGPLGGPGKTVEADETYFGTEEGKSRGRQGPNAMNKIFSLVERGGNVRSFHVADVTGVEQLNNLSKLMKDMNIAHLTLPSLVFLGSAAHLEKLPQDSPNASLLQKLALPDRPADTRQPNAK